MRKALLFFSAFGVGLALVWTNAFAQFDGAPTAPQPLNSHPEFANWDVQVHQRSGWMQDENDYIQRNPDHGSNCAGNPNPLAFPTHTNSSFSGNAFVCNNHVMTFADGDGYGLTVLTPNQLVDLSGGPVTVRFEMSTFRTSARDWVELRFTPWEDNLTLPGEIGDVDLQGNPERHVDFVMGQHPCSRGLCSDWNLHTDDTSGNLNAQASPSWHDIAGFAPDKARRDKFEIILTTTHVKFWMPDYGLVFYDRDIPQLSWTKGVFQLEHHTYTAEKGQCIDNCPDSLPDGTTWHWDEVQITPNVPFSITHATERSFSSQTNEGAAGPSHCFNFTGHSSQNAFLRFSAFAEVDVDFGCDGGWQRAEPQVRRQGSVKSYFVAMPAGVTKVAFRLWRRNEATWDNTPQYVRDITFWSQGASAPAAYAVSWTADDTPASMNADATQNVTLSFTNSGSSVWNASGANPVRLAYHWRNGACPGTATAVWDGIRTPLAANVSAGTSVSNLVAQVKAPSASGTYCLQFDLIKEGVTWFSTQGAAVLNKTVTISTAGSAYGVSWTADNTPGSMNADATQNVTLSFTNIGSSVWNASGANPVRLSYHWRHGACAGTGTAVWDGLRTPLAANVNAGTSVSNLVAQVKAPSASGTYCLQFDLIKEGVTWFSTQGAAVLNKTVTISTAGSAYGVSWTADNTPGSMNADATQNVTLSFTNTGTSVWNASGTNPVRLSYHWRNGACPGTGTSVWDGLRTLLAGNVNAGASVSNLVAQVRAPSGAGTYCLQFDLVKEGVTWFSTQGAVVLSKTVTVETPN